MTIGRVTKYIGLGVLVLLVVALLALLVFRQSGNSRLQQTLAALRADGQPTTLAELVGPTLPREKNAFTYIKQAEPALNEIEAAVSKAEEPRRDENFNETVPSRAEVLAALRAALADKADTIALLHKAAECPGFNSDLTEVDLTIGEAFLDHLHVKRQAARALNYHADVALADGDPQTALQDGIAILKLSRLFDADPTLVNYLVAVAIRGVAVDVANRALRAGPLPADLHLALDEELAKHDLVAAYRHALSTERPYGLHMFDELSSTPTTWLLNISADTDDYLRYMELGILFADRPYSDKQVRAELNRAINQSGRFTQLIAPAIGAASEANHRVTAQLRCLRVLNALLQRSADAAVPTNVSDLGLPADATTDPFNGQSLIIKPTPDGWIVYSLGRKLSDDGGDGLFSDDIDRNIGLGTESMRLAAEAEAKAAEDALQAELRAINEPPAETPAEPPAEKSPDENAPVEAAPADESTPAPGS